MLIAPAFIAYVIGVTDGDTLTVLHNNKPVKIRLAEIDAPEKKQPFGMRSKQSLSDLCFNARAEVKPSATDRYARTVARVSCAGKDASAAQLQAGMAWVYVKYSTDKSLLAIQEEARVAHRGLWSEPAPVPPWEWRHR